VSSMDTTRGQISRLPPILSPGSLVLFSQKNKIARRGGTGRSRTMSLRGKWHGSSFAPRFPQRDHDR
jgi:hypothetical protein